MRAAALKGGVLISPYSHTRGLCFGLTGREYMSDMTLMQVAT
jgi:hypothetical protein